MKFLSDEVHPSLPCIAVLASAIMLFFSGMFAVSASSEVEQCTKVKFSISPSFPLNINEAKLYGFEKHSTTTFTCSAEAINGFIKPRIYIFSNKEAGTNTNEGVSSGTNSLLHGINSTWSKGNKIQEVFVDNLTLSFNLWETTCDHTGTWKCRAVYQYLGRTDDIDYWCRQQLTVSTFPTNLQISFQPPYKQYYLGDPIKVMCTGFMGSEDATWVFESRMPRDPEGEWPEHYDGFISTSPRRIKECQVTGGAILSINISERDEGKIFRCLIKRPGHWFVELAATALPIILLRDITNNPVSRPVPKKSNECSVKVWTIFGATIGGVLLFVIVIEVSYYAIVVWRQKNSRRPSLFPDIPSPPLRR
ncbi:uncharacterized protein LOC112576347 [Pomacea canaliculata]|uniref:uncharacterized protein LOC112576347 n=1 Tax=Pomacea canaliculata TaxID=400727 RepID=UPI000D72B0DD|nr:uncharacterized protein LOC112576347 [Pomacea canaliculata]XP_025114501.1 uncharacterized protein LOC112576347 [Pomacea canaliculata]